MGDDTVGEDQTGADPGTGDAWSAESGGAATDSAGGDWGGQAADAAMSAPYTRYHPVCTNCGWEGQINSVSRSDAVEEANNHVDDHPQCAGKVEIRENHDW